MPSEGEQTDGAVAPAASTSADLVAAAERARRRLTLLQEIAAALAALRDPAEVADAVVTRVRPALGASLVSVRRLTPERTLDVVALRPDAAGLSGLRSIPLDADVPATEAVRRRTPLWFPSREDLAARHPRQLEFAAALGISAAVALPLCVEDRCLGSLALFFDAPRAFDEEERGFIQSIAVHCAEALERARLFEAERSARRLAERAYAELDSIVGNAPLGVAFLDHEMRFRRVNRVLAEMNGMTIEEHIGRTPRELFPGLPLELLERQFREVLATGAPLLDTEIVGEGRNTPGVRRVALASWYPVRVAGATEGVGVLVREVTAEREAQEFQRHVLAVVGHDLRSPLSAVYGLAALLRRAPLGEREAGLVARIEASARRMQEILQAVLDYTHVRRGGGVPVERRPCDVAELCRAIALECEAAHPGREVRCGGTGVTAGRWDAGRVAQLLGNLVGNALQHGDPDRPVEVRWSGTDDAVVIEVANRGPAIPPEVLARIFEPFERAGARGGSGLGLGLFIARQVALAHGGRIEVRSDEAEGTVFTVVLPRSSAAG